MSSDPIFHWRPSVTHGMLTWNKEKASNHLLDGNAPQLLQMKSTPFPSQYFTKFNNIEMIPIELIDSTDKTEVSKSARHQLKSESTPKGFNHSIWIVSTRNPTRPENNLQTVKAVATLDQRKIKNELLQENVQLCRTKISWIVSRLTSTQSNAHQEWSQDRKMARATKPPTYPTTTRPTQCSI